MDRRRFLVLAGASLGGLAGRPLRPASESASAITGPLDLETIDLRLDGTGSSTGRALVFTPRSGASAGASGTEREPPRLPLLLLLHGLGETTSPELGIHAWSERYGLLEAYRRLRNPPVERTVAGTRYLSRDRATAIDRSLATQPFEPMVIVCPYMPRLRRGAGPGPIDAYADWIETTLLPAVRARTRATASARGMALAGCSLGGFVGLEMLLLKPKLFGSLAGVQSAIQTAAAARYAMELKRAPEPEGGRRILIETSTKDPYRHANQAFSAELRRLGVPHDFLEPPGPHTQPWLRDVGTLEMLLWADRALSL